MPKSMRVIGKISLSFVTLISGSYIYSVYNHDDWQSLPQKYVPAVVDGFSTAGPRLLGFLVANFPKQSLQLCQSEHFYIRRLAQQLIASAHYPVDFDLGSILKNSSVDAFVGLSRNPLLDDDLFGTENKVSEHESLNNSLRDLLSFLPTVDLDSCAKWFTDSVFHGGKSGRHLYKTISWSPADETDLDSVSPEVAVPLFLKALRKHSELRKHRSLIMKHNGLDVLQVIAEHYFDDKNIRLLSCVLGNLALDKESRKRIISKGWIKQLKKWTKSEDITIRSNSLRALANLDRDGERGFKYEDGIFVVYPTMQLKCCKPEVDVVFVHGLRGSPFRTWRSRDSSGNRMKTECWPGDWLPADVPNCRVIMVEYDSELSDWTSQCFLQPEISSIEYRSSELMRKLASAGVGQRPVIWVAHSMGGLLVKQLLVDSTASRQFSSLSTNTRGLIFYAVPHKGSDVASLVSGKARFVLRPSLEVKELQKGSELLESLHVNFLKCVSEGQIDVLSYGETEPARIVNRDAFLVPRESAEIGVGEFVELAANHFSVCKPTSTDDPCYIKTVTFVKDHTMETAEPGYYTTVILF